MAKRKGTKGQTTIYKTKDGATRIPLELGGSRTYSGTVFSCSTCGTRRVTHAMNPVISHKDRIVIMTKGTYSVTVNQVMAGTVNKPLFYSNFRFHFQIYTTSTSKHITSGKLLKTTEENYTFTPTTLTKEEILDNIRSVLCSFRISPKDDELDLPSLCRIAKLHKCSFKQRLYCWVATCSTKPLSQLLTCILSAVKTGLQSYCDNSYSRGGVNQMWNLKNSKDLHGTIQLPLLLQQHKNI